MPRTLLLLSSLVLTKPTMHLSEHIALIAALCCHSASAHMRQRRFNTAPFQPTNCVTTLTSTSTTSCIYSDFPTPTLSTPLSTVPYSTVPAFATPAKYQIVLDKNTQIEAENDVDIYDIDLDSSQATFTSLINAKKYIICYFSAGTSETFRDDIGCFNSQHGEQDYGCNFGGEFPNEFWLNTSSTGVRAIMLHRLDQAQAKKCNAIDPDNIDSYSNPNGIGATQNDSIDYLTWLAHEAHIRGLAIGLKNSAELAADPGIVSIMDFAVTEECVVKDECNLYSEFSKQTKSVFNIEYPINTAEPVATPTNPANLPWSSNMANERCKAHAKFDMKGLITDLKDYPTIKCNVARCPNPVLAPEGGLLAPKGAKRAKEAINEHRKQGKTSDLIALMYLWITLARLGTNNLISRSFHERPHHVVRLKMAGFRYYQRRLKNLTSSPSFQGIFICVCLFFCVRWVLRHNHDDYDTLLPQSARPTTSVDDETIDWSKLAFVMYATSPEYLCNALMVWSEIEEIGSRARRVLMYPSAWDPNEIDELDPGLRLTPIARLLQSAIDDYKVTLHPVSVLHQNNSKEATWADSYTKLLAFNLTSYDRVLTLDSDSVVLQNLDELFLLPKAPLAMPYVYWGAPTNWAYSSQLLLLEPSAEAFSTISAAIEKAKPDEYDMDILAHFYKTNKPLRIPQNPYNLLSGEFRRSTHMQYLSSRSPQDWDPDLALHSAKFLHFSDWPIPKPWIRAKQDVVNKYMPKCRQKEWFGATDCRDREVWLQLYFDFAMKRKMVCGAGFELQSQVLPPDSVLRHGKWYHPDEVN
ncbi:hypothetical protein G7Y89_g12694 [Cudoniella acicularis]|uniref:alpha-galactosidase n=1 Tax=Cudoniella acicularis TaxID=354080 RepID=A0A8H4R8P4_9HELO|nr:hypothetical protein G7Y89_g12694 [Cudoniella acicularis]